MPIRDIKLLPNSKTAEHLFNSPVATAVSKTAQIIWTFKPGYNFKLTRVGLGNVEEAGAVSLQAYIVRDDGMLNSSALAIDAVPEKFKTGAFSYMIAGVGYAKAAATAEVFAAAYTVTASKWGAFLIQINAAGTVTSKVVSNAQAYATEAEAILALPAPTAANVRIGYITVNADSGGWTATTDDMTDGSDCTEANFYSTPTAAPFLGNTVPVLGSALDAVSGKYVEGTLSSEYKRSIGSATDIVVLTYTSDGSGALTAGLATVGIRAFPLNGESIPASYRE